MSSTAAASTSASATKTSVLDDLCESSLRVQRDAPLVWNGFCQQPHLYPPREHGCPPQLLPPGGGISPAAADAVHKFRQTFLGTLLRDDDVRVDGFVAAVQAAGRAARTRYAWPHGDVRGAWADPTNSAYAVLFAPPHAALVRPSSIGGTVWLVPEGGVHRLPKPMRIFVSPEFKTTILPEITRRLTREQCAMAVDSGGGGGSSEFEKAEEDDLRKRQTVSFSFAGRLHPKEDPSAVYATSRALAIVLNKSCTTDLAPTPESSSGHLFRLNNCGACERCNSYHDLRFGYDSKSRLVFSVCS